MPMFSFASSFCKKFFFLFLFQAVFTFTINAQLSNLSFQRIGVDQGLSQGTVFGIYQDSLGFIWFATADGLNRYDGYSFKIYRQQASANSENNTNCFRNIFQSTDKNSLWISTTGPDQLYHFNLLTGELKLVVAGDNKRLFSDILPFKEKENELWFFELTKGIECLDKSTGKIAAAFPENKHVFGKANSVLSIENDKVIFIKVEGLLSFDLKTHKTDTLLKVPILTPVSYFQTLCRDKNTIWIGTINSLVKYDLLSKEQKTYSIPEIGKNSAGPCTLAIVNADDRYLFLGTEKHGLLMFDKQTETFQQYVYDKRDAQSIAANRVPTLFIDRSKNLWVANDPYGICKSDLKKEKFHHAFESSSLSVGLKSNFIKCFLQDGETVYIGTYDKGLNVWNRKTNSYSYFLQEPAKNETASEVTQMAIYAMEKDSKGNVWIVSEKGLSVLNKSSNTVSTPFAGKLREVYAVKLLSDDSVLLGVPAGVLLVTKKGNEYNLVPVVKKEEAEVKGFFKSKKNGLLYFSAGEVSRLEKDPRTNVLHASLVFEYNGSRIKCLYGDSREQLWMGTENGLLKMSADFRILKMYTEKEGLPNSFIYGIEEDKNGDLWVSTNKGLSQFDPAKETFKNYSVADGLQANEFNTGAYYKNEKGELFFGGVNGFNYFYPEEVKSNEFTPHVVLTSFKLSDKDYVTDTTIEYKKRIVLDYTQNSISFEYAALEFTNPEKNQYAYRLTGVDENWVLAGKNRYARYADLNPGNYMFEVKASNNDGIWAAHPAFIYICITPPFWKTWYFILFTILFFITITFVIIRYFTARKYKLQLREVQIEQSSRLKAIIETEEKERKRIAGELHDGLGQMLSTARLSVSGLGKPTADEKEKMLVEKSLKIIDEACEEVRNISHNMMPGALIQMGLIPALEDLFENINASGQLEVVFETNITAPVGESTEIAIYRVIQEICNNSIRHAKAKHIYVSITKNNDMVDVEIKDDGIGFSPEVIEKSTGIGWKNIYSRVSSLNGTLKIDSVINKGTTIKIQVKAQ